ncbi:hypothetical protein TL16_g04911 [Triparma laevis f. inornata]|uniref:Uncharacterized protein n=2 Tax=Triparma laevis TaxID=1534972 RepID=A0A9W6ZZ21_9STRA|nr:hypothetical protein TrLO_g14675 [Triparma laevis f. longispina]GMH68367.1 hypothetical protein TL16_g04911 [Triparma laevis f. inornata]
MSSLIDSSDDTEEEFTSMFGMLLDSDSDDDSTPQPSSAPLPSVVTLASSLSNSTKLSKRTINHTPSSVSSIPTHLPPFTTVDSITSQHIEILHSVSTLGVSRHFASEIITSNILPLILSYIQPQWEKKEEERGMWDVGFEGCYYGLECLKNLACAQMR